MAKEVGLNLPPFLMRILAWNCRGAGRAPIVRTISALSYSEGPDVLFLAETKIASPKSESLNRRLVSLDFLVKIVLAR
jgi:exonuclease III